MASANFPDQTYVDAGDAAAQAAAEAASQPLDSDLTAIAALSTTTYGRALLALTNQAALQTAVGLGTAGTMASSAFDAAGAAAAAQSASQPLDSDLTAIAALATTSYGRSLLTLANQAALVTALGNIPETQVTNLTTDLAAKASLLLTQTAQTANYTLVLADAGTLVEMNSASATTVTVPPNSSVAFPVGTVIELARMGAGTVTVAPGAGVTVDSAAGAVTVAAQYSSASLRKRATNEWVLVGALA